MPEFRDRESLAHEASKQRATKDAKMQSTWSSMQPEARLGSIQGGTVRDGIGGTVFQVLMRGYVSLWCTLNGGRQYWSPMLEPGWYWVNSHGDIYTATPQGERLNLIYSLTDRAASQPASGWAAQAGN